MAEKNFNRIKVMLAEKGKTYQCLPTSFRSINTDSSMSGS